MLGFVLSLLVLIPTFSLWAAELPCPEFQVPTTSLPILPVIQPPKLCYATVIASLLSFEAGQAVSVLKVANLVERKNDGLREEWRAFLYGTRAAYYRFQSFGQKDSVALKESLAHGACEQTFLDQFQIESIDLVFSELEKVREERPNNLLENLKLDFNSHDPDFAARLFQRSLKSRLPLIDLSMDLLCHRLQLSASLSPQSQAFENWSFDQAALKINELTKLKKPIAIGYDFNYFYEKEADREHAQHASTLIAQTWNKSENRCEYTIRFTDLETCKLINSGKCKTGLIQVPRNEFIKVLSDITWIQ